MRNRLPFSAARQTGGFTLVELLVVIGIIAILAGVALGPITHGITKARESAALQTCRTIALAEFQYANDNNGSYPYGTAPNIASALFSGNYISDTSIFLLPNDPGTSKYAGAANGTFTTINNSFDFMDVNGTSGLGSSTPDQCPVVWSPDSHIPAIPTGTTPQGVEFPPNNPIFGTDGIAIAYHSNNSFFRAPIGIAPTDPNAYLQTKGDALFIDNSFNPNGITYTKETGHLGY